MDHRTALEKDLHTLLKELLDTFAVGRHLKTNREDYVKMMGDVKNAKIHLDNKMLGCQSGSHAGECLCDRGIQKTKEAYRRERKVA